MPYAYGAETTVTFSGTVFNSFVRLIKPELRSGRLAFASMRASCAWIWSNHERRVQAVVFRDARTGVENRVACSAVVLAAGAIGTAEILLASSSAEFSGRSRQHARRARTLTCTTTRSERLSLIWELRSNPTAFVLHPSDARPRAPALRCRVHAMEWTETLARSLCSAGRARCRGIGSACSHDGAHP